MQHFMDKLKNFEGDFVFNVDISIEFVTIFMLFFTCFGFFFCHEACGILAPEPTTSLEGKTFNWTARVALRVRSLD